MQLSVLMKFFVLEDGISKQSFSIAKRKANY